MNPTAVTELVNQVNSQHNLTDYYAQTSSFDDPISCVANTIAWNVERYEYVKNFTQPYMNGASTVLNRCLNTPAISIQYNSFTGTAGMAFAPILNYANMTVAILEWPASNPNNGGTVQYSLERTPGNSTTGFVQIYSGPLLGFTDVNLIPTTNYNYRLMATNNQVGTASYGPVLSMKTQSSEFFTTGFAMSESQGIGATTGASTQPSPSPSSGVVHDEKVGNDAQKITISSALLALVGLRLWLL